MGQQLNWNWQIKNRPGDLTDFADYPQVVMNDYDFDAQTPGVDLTAGITNTITLTPVPKGINATNTGHYVYISGGTGTAECVLITGGTAVSEATSGTITFVPANTHSGAWTITSASAGMLEAMWGNNTYGAEITVPRGSHRIRCKITPPNTGGTTPLQKPFYFRGQGCGCDGLSGAPSGGSILNMEYSGTVAKIVTVGRGTLGFSQLAMYDDSSGNTTAFCLTTNTRLVVDDVYIYGSGASPATSTTQDAFILGGTTISTDGTPDAPFQGYGTIFNNCKWEKVRRAVFGRVYANGVQIINPTIWSGGGGSAAIEFNGTYGAGNAIDGLLIVGGIIENVHYTYGIVLDNASHATLLGVNFYDQDGTTVAHVWNKSNSYFNQIFAGTWTTGAAPYLLDDNTLNNFFCSDSNLTRSYLNNVKIRQLIETLPVDVSSSNTSFLGDATQLILRGKNTSNTANNWVSMAGISYAGIYAAGFGIQFTDHANGYAELGIFVRGAGGGGNMREVLRVCNDGTIKLAYLPSVSPGAGTLKLWYDATDGNRVKFSA